MAPSRRDSIVTVMEPSPDLQPTENSDHLAADAHAGRPFLSEIRGQEISAIDHNVTSARSNIADLFIARHDAVELERLLSVGADAEQLVREFARLFLQMEQSLQSQRANLAP